MTGGGRAQLGTKEVLEWFQEAGIKRLPLPTEKDIQPIADAVNLWRRKSPPQLDEASQITYAKYQEMLSLQLQAAARLSGAHKLLRRMLMLADEVKGFEPLTNLVEARALLPVLEAFLKRHPPRTPGGGGAGLWQSQAPEWAMVVASCLVAAGWPRASTTNDGGVVPLVVSHMSREAFREKIAPESVARYLRSPEGRQVIRALKSE